MIAFRKRDTKGTGYVGWFFDEWIRPLGFVISTLTNKDDLPKVRWTAEIAPDVTWYHLTKGHVVQAVKRCHKSDQADQTTVQLFKGLGKFELHVDEVDRPGFA